MYREPPALKHGAYSGTAILPGEDPAAFAKLLEEIEAEFKPVGAMEKEIVFSMARSIWRKKNLKTYRFKRQADEQASKVWDDLPPSKHLIPIPKDNSDPTREKLAEFEKIDRHLKKRLGGTAWALYWAGDQITIEHLETELAMEDRLDGMFDRSLKRLLMVRGVKSVLQSASINGETPKRLTTAA